MSRRSFGTSLYIWTAMPRLGPKATEIKQALVIPKGVPRRIEAFDKLNIDKLSVGMRHSAIITKEGQLYTFGSGNWGNLGHGNEKDVRYDAPQLVEFFEKKNKKVVDIALGEYHSAALTDDGELYTWGYAGKTGFFNWMYAQEVGALGHGDKKHHFLPKKVDFFDQKNIKIKSVHAGLYHTCVLSQNNDIYTWGRGLYGVLGNGSNQYSLLPELNDEIKSMRDEDPQGKTIVKVSAADEFTGILMKDGSLYVWGKNDKGQMGVGAGIGIDMVESENVPAQVNVIDQKKQVQLISDFTTGQNTMLIKDIQNQVYKTGLKLDYTPKQLQFFDEFPSQDITQLACGRKHYVILNKNNQLLVWGNVFKDKPQKLTEGFGLYFGDQLFEGGKVKYLSMKYSIYGALVEHK